MINEQLRLIHEDQDKFIFETIRTYTDGVLAHEGIIKIPKKLLERAITCFKMEHPAEFELLLNGDEGMKRKKFQTDFADLIDDLSDIIENSDDICSKVECIVFLRAMANEARYFNKKGGKE